MPREELITNMVSKEALDEFIELYRQEYGVVLPQQAAVIKAEKLLTLMRSVFKPIPKDSPFIEIEIEKVSETVSKVSQNGHGNERQKAIKTR